MKKIVIDDVEYTPRSFVISDEAKKILSEVYGALWTEGYYDAFNEATQKFSRPLADKMKRLNEILEFKK